MDKLVETLSKRILNERDATIVYQKRSELLEEELALTRVMLRDAVAKVPVHEETKKASSSSAVNHSKRPLDSPELKAKAFKKGKGLSYPAFKYQLESGVIVEREEGKQDDFNRFDYLLFKVRDLTLNQMLQVYQYLPPSGSSGAPVLFVSKRHLETYFQGYALKVIRLIDDKGMIGKRFLEWADSCGEKYRWNSGFVTLDLALVSKMMSNELGASLALGLAYLLKNARDY